MSVSDSKLAANRENAKLSTGPRTAEGKKRSRLNALRHGLTGQVVVMPYEDLQAYQAFVDERIQDLAHKSGLEKQLGVDIANTMWKLNRLSMIENGLYAMGHHDNADRNKVDSSEVHTMLTAAVTYEEHSKSLDNLNRQESRLRRGLQQSVKLYQDVQARRRVQESNEIPQAMRIAKTHRMQNLPYEPAVDGFVLSRNSIDRRLNREEHIRQAKIAEDLDYSAEKFRARMAA